MSVYAVIAHTSVRPNDSIYLDCDSYTMAATVASEQLRCCIETNDGHKIPADSVTIVHTSSKNRICMKRDFADIHTLKAMARALGGLTTDHHIYINSFT